MEGISVVGMIITFVVATIVLFVGITIIGGVSTGFDCKNLQGYDSTGATDAEKYPSDTWAGSCKSLQTQSQSSYQLLVIVLIVIAAGAILTVVVRHFTV